MSLFREVPSLQQPSSSSSHNVNNTDNNNEELLQTIETQSAQINQLQNQINDLYNALDWAMPQLNGLTIESVIIYSGGDLNNFDNINFD